MKACRLHFAAVAIAIANIALATSPPSAPDLVTEAVLRHSLAPFNNESTDPRKWCLHIQGDDDQVSRMVLHLAKEFPRLVHHAECTLRWFSIGAEAYDDVHTGEKLAFVRIKHLRTHNDGTASVSLGIQRGGLNGFGRDFVLKREGDKYVVVSAKVTWVS